MTSVAVKRFAHAGSGTVFTNQQISTGGREPFCSCKPFPTPGGIRGAFGNGSRPLWKTVRRRGRRRFCRGNMRGAEKRFATPCGRLKRFPTPTLRQGVDDELGGFVDQPEEGA